MIACRQNNAGIGSTKTLTETAAVEKVKQYGRNNSSKKQNYDLGQ